MSGHPKGAIAHRVICCGGGYDHLAFLLAVPASGFAALQNGPPEPFERPAWLTEKLPDGEYYLIGGKWVGAEDIKP